LEDKNITFITWIIPLFKTEFYEKSEYVFNEGDNVEDIFFLHEGTANFVLPIMKNYPYIKINSGNHFGVIDIIGCQLEDDEDDLSLWYDDRANLHRFFTI